MGDGVVMVVVKKLWEAQRRGGVDFWGFLSTVRRTHRCVGRGMG